MTSSQILRIEVVATTQNTKGSSHFLTVIWLDFTKPAVLLTALGPVDPALGLYKESLGSLLVASIDKTSFSMLIPEVESIVRTRSSPLNIVVMGIEVRPNSHVLSLPMKLFSTRLTSVFSKLHWMFLKDSPRITHTSSQTPSLLAIPLRYR